jgi:hypothetical protein
MIQMTEGDRSVPRPSAIRAAAQLRPRTCRFAEWTLAVLLGLPLTGIPAETQAWSHVVVVDEGHSKGPVLQAAFHRVAATGIGGNATAQVLKRLGEYIDSEVAARGRAGLSIGLAADAVTAAKAARWPPEDMARLVVALHRKFDPAQPLGWPPLHRVVERIRQGSRPDEILGTGDTLKETAPSR